MTKIAFVPDFADDFYSHDDVSTGLPGLIDKNSLGLIFDFMITMSILISEQTLRHLRIRFNVTHRFEWLTLTYRKNKKNLYKMSIQNVSSNNSNPNNVLTC